MLGEHEQGSSGMWSLQSMRQQHCHILQGADNITQVHTGPLRNLGMTEICQRARKTEGRAGIEHCSTGAKAQPKREPDRGQNCGRQSQGGRHEVRPWRDEHRPGMTSSEGGGDGWAPSVEV